MGGLQFDTQYFQPAISAWPWKVMTTSIRTDAVERPCIVDDDHHIFRVLCSQHQVPGTRKLRARITNY
ncbi:hypothetical protein HZ326_3220 [Fusarium oxysporum f. sp. albedinis]|nr:hypothetical protein HZ326_3220 [Fusarium oxysporum f. sp. albedinis]